MTREPAIGDLVVYRTLSGAAVARVDLVRARSVTAFPWRQADRRWDKRRFVIERTQLVETLVAGTDPVPVADHLNVLSNRRAAERMRANSVFDQRMHCMLRTLEERV